MYYARSNEQNMSYREDKVSWKDPSYIVVSRK